MNDALLEIQKNAENLYPGSISGPITLYPGIELCYLAFTSDSFSVHHKALAHMMQINYCKSGQILWKMKNGNHIYLNPGDFSLHAMSACTHSELLFPNGAYQGLTIYIDLQKASDAPPEPLNSAVFETLFSEKNVPGDTPVFLAGNEQTEHIFSSFYNQPETLQLSYQKIKVIELLLYLAKTGSTPQTQLPAYQSGQIAVIRKIHDQILSHMEQRITIEELSRQYLINPTTLKNAFKAVYGTSLAAHIRKHRMEQAADLLRETDKSIAEIAQAVGYDSQSKFTAAFKNTYNILPREYRKRNSMTAHPAYQVTYPSASICTPSDIPRI